MKHIHAAYLIAVLVLAACCFSIWRVYTIKEEVFQLVDALETSLAQEDIPQIQRDAQNLYDHWHLREPQLIRLVRHDSMDDITMAMASIPELARYEMLPELSAELQKVRDTLQHAWESELPTWNNLI